MDDETIIDMCPVCKSTPITTPGLRFKISPKCYHRICEGCVDRKFISGKAECPISGCKQQLWKRDWKVQTFEDLKIEREIDLRRRVTKILDRKEAEFESKRDYDDFLELREELIMNLVFGTDVVVTRKKLSDYEEANGLRKVSVEDKKVGGKTWAKDMADPSGLIKGLRKIEAPVVRSPYDPFTGMAREKGYYELRGDYRSSRHDRYADKSSVHSIGGYDFGQFWDESLSRAFAGMGVFIQDEMAKETAMVQ